MAKLKLDLHEIYNRGYQIDTELNRIVQEAIDRKIELALCHQENGPVQSGATGQRGPYS